MSKYISMIIISVGVLAANLTLASQSKSGFSMNCSDKYFELGAANEDDTEISHKHFPTLKGITVSYFDFKEKVVECLIGEEIISASISRRSVSVSGPCGARPGFTLSILINNISYIKNALFNNQCYESIENFKYSIQPRGNKYVSLCGKSDSWSMDFSGCIGFKNGSVEQLIKPIPKFPFSAFLANKLLQPTANAPVE